MSGTVKDGGAAFPISVQPNFQHAEAGMTLRDYFAGQAIMGLCADPSNHKLFDGPADAAANAYFIADAMLAERSKP